MTKREQISAQQRLLYGRDSVPPRRDLETGWKAVKAIAAGGRVLDDAAKHCLLGRMAAAGTPADVVDDVMRWDERSERLLATLAGVTSPPDARAWILYEGLSVAMVDDSLTDDQLERARSVADALDIAPEALDELAELCRQEWDLRIRRVHLLSARSTSGYRFDLL